MPLAEIDIPLTNTVIPPDVERFLSDVDERVSQFVEDNPKRETGFVPSDYVSVYRALGAIQAAGLTPGKSFCEWGSGFGVVSSLASMLGFNVCGIEIRGELVAASRTLAEEFDVSAEFAEGSFVPQGSECHAAEAYSDNNGEYSWLAKEADNAYNKLGRPLCSFDLVFAYPWPGECYFIEKLFEDGAATDAVLLTFEDIDSIRVRRKVIA